MKIRKAIIPVAGLGTRFLPATKAQPKEMLPVVDKPVIQYIVEEAVAAGIEQIIFVTSHTKRAIEDHFDRNFELEYRLQEGGKKDQLEIIKRLSTIASFAYVRQREPRGDGHAILEAAHLIGNEPVAIMHGDYIIDSAEPGIGQLIEVYDQYQSGVIGVQRVTKEQISKHGIVKGRPISEQLYEVEGLVEKPKPENAPSDLGIKGRYIVTPEVMEELRRVPPAADGEIRLIDGFKGLLGRQPIYCRDINGDMYDCGNKLQYLIAQVEYGLKHAEVNKDRLFADFLVRRAAELNQTSDQPKRH
ncbi:MAG: UTP--glucose-1-phosphate uridylyltransferase GalU [Patescibacteria group bacterium]